MTEAIHQHRHNEMMIRAFQIHRERGPFHISDFRRFHSDVIQPEECDCILQATAEQLSYVHIEEGIQPENKVTRKFRLALL